MDFNKFCENGKKIKLTEEKKAEIINVSKESEVQKAAPFSPNLKRIAAAVCAMIIMVTAVFVYNKHNDTNDIPIHSATEQSEKESLKAVETTTVQPSQKIENTEDNDVGGGELTLQKYRSIYYSIPSPFWDVVDENGRNDIYGEYWEEPYSEINIMRMKIFVEEYNVPREKFDAANAEWARIIKEKLYGTPVINPQDYANQEFNEVYNADIIYTFDNELINEYYLSHDYPYCYESEYEKAVEDGLYNTRTDRIIDVSELEDELAFFNQLKNETSTGIANPIESATSTTNETETTE